MRIVLAEPDPAWAHAFARHEARIRGALGEGERTKRQLAEREWERGQAYADAKGEVVEAILARALTSYRP